VTCSLHASGLTLLQMTATAFGANIAGQANLENGQQFHMEGTIEVWICAGPRPYSLTVPWLGAARWREPFPPT